MTSLIKPPKNLLLPDEPSPIGVYNPCEKGDFLFLCEHAQNRIPISLNTLGLPQSEIDRHIGWDIGALETATALADRLQSQLFFQQYSRLIIDCNRPLDSRELIPAISETTEIPGNQQISETQRQQRIDHIWRPYQQSIRNYLNRQPSKGIIIVSVHSFTPVFRDTKRPWQIGLLFNRCPDTAYALRERLLFYDPGLNIGMNQPYDICDQDDYTIPVFGEAMGFAHVLIEIRNNLINNSKSRKKWIELFSKALLDLTP